MLEYLFIRKFDVSGLVLEEFKHLILWSFLNVFSIKRIHLIKVQSILTFRNKVFLIVWIRIFTRILFNTCVLAIFVLLFLVKIQIHSPQITMILLLYFLHLPFLLKSLNLVPLSLSDEQLQCPRLQSIFFYQILERTLLLAYLKIELFYNSDHLVGCHLFVPLSNFPLCDLFLFEVVKIIEPETTMLCSHLQSFLSHTFSYSYPFFLK